MIQQPILAAISYAHGPRDREVIALADRLNREGVDCDVDAYDVAPPEGWPRRMETMMMRRTVLVIASDAYYRRYHLQEREAVGLGATFETGLLAQRVLEMQGRNEGIIPVLLASDDVRFIPEFLRGVTRYDLSEPDGYEHLYRRLTGQPQYVKPPLGELRLLPPKNETATITPDEPPVDNRALALFQSNAGLFGVHLVEVERGQTLKATLSPDDESELVRLRSLQGQQRFGLAFGTTALFARVKSSRERLVGNKQQIELELIEEPVDSSFGSEMSFNGISADKIAEMRARRILLDEKLQQREREDWAGRLNDTTFDSFVAGGIAGGNRLSVKASPLPLLAKSSGITRHELLAAGRLACVMWLILTGTVEHITKLEMKMVEAGIQVSFEGIRHRAYLNCEPAKIKVDGICPIEGLF